MVIILNLSLLKPNLDFFQDLKALLGGLALPVAFGVLGKTGSSRGLIWSVVELPFWLSLGVAVS